jgi:hypothetical protein
MDAATDLATKTKLEAAEAVFHRAVEDWVKGGSSAQAVRHAIKTITPVLAEVLSLLS